jgi:hypothetical protein
MTLQSGAAQNLRGKTNFADRGLVLEMCTRLALRVPGNVMEFGVYNGDSTLVIAKTLRRFAAASIEPRRRFWALDSFEGLPESYENAVVGTFACEPPRIRGVDIVKGYFDKTLTPEFSKQVGKVALAHLDADLYSSTLCALRFLTPLLDTGSILVFDEFLGGGEAESRAFHDWVCEAAIQPLLVAEFAREGSGFNIEKTDVRAVYQIVKSADIPRQKPPSELQRRAGYYYRRIQYRLGGE